ncbi:MAG TPA: TolC family outer membrane protein [Verrucomicrobiae bacterium]|nr:TolC family outer membrane protein [Verrucomicrobiae bacterium]
MRILNSLLLAALVAPSVASANELMRVYDLAVINDPTMRAQRGARDYTAYGEPAARGALLPQLSGSGIKSEGESTTTTTITPTPPGSTTNGQPRDSDDESQTLQLDLRQALFDATAWNRWQQAEANADAANATYRIAEQNLILRAAEAYFTLVASADSVRFADAEKKAVERSLELAKRRFEVGLSAITDVQEAQARYDLTVAQMIEAEQVLDIAKVLITEITADPATTIVPLRDEIPLLGPSPDNINDWLKASAANNLSTAVARSLLEAADQGVDLARAGHYPSLYAFGRQSETERKGVEFGAFTDTQGDSLTYGVQLNVPIFAGFTVMSNVNSAKGLREQREGELEAQRRAVERSTRNAYQGVIAGVSRVKALKQAVLSSTTALEASDVGLEVGARTAVDVLNAQRELFLAQRNHARARYDYLLNILRLKALAGQLMRKDLAEIDALLGSEPAMAPAPASPDATPG